MEAKIRAVGLVIVELVRATGSAGIPDGELYAELQAAFGEAWSLSLHNSVVGSLVDGGALRRERYLLTAPAPAEVR
jgi:hypothetical protein